MFAIAIWILSLLLLTALLFISVFVLISFSDLEGDYLNPIDLTRRLNPLVLPEYGVFFVMLALFVLGGFIPEVLVNIPLAGWYSYCLAKKTHKVDATQVFSELTYHKTVALVKLVFFMLSFFFYLYRMVFYLVQDYVN
eukprot:m51a1_g341 putative er-derived vesicles protein erv14 (138) ;mRNA; r:526960-527713